MKIFAWNARGLGSSRAFNTLRYHKQEVKPKVMFLIETRCGHDKMEKWHVSPGYKGKLMIDCQGKSGGLCMFWDSRTNINLMSYSQTHIDVCILRDGSQRWRFMGFYGNPDHSQRYHSWTLLKRLAGMVDLSWVCMGDFNEIMFDSEKCGGLPKNWRELVSFREAVEECNLMDMGYRCPRFTWSNKREGSATIMERLDRGLYDVECSSIVSKIWSTKQGGEDIMESILRTLQLCGERLGTWNVEKRISLTHDFVTRRETLRNACKSNKP
ncbi:hypothetical protein Ddye_005076 [Dipteronia dyeriana]|uniref:Endonuclease/exonuclease/phosphatase domain-containing protein n=1 Tax=Dipteronia dyeriana TaxID=168575 RepID=A0AAE0CPW8_9ROSI|nr:hypothetical protein Ddye_005076 [Dipteronia dyeriana]